MRIEANGFPKSGNHALAKACELLGLPVEVQHLTYREKVAGGKYILIVRDPRNIVVSMLRFRYKPQTPGMFITTFRKFQDKPLVEELGEYEGWLGDSETLAVKFEDLIVGQNQMEKIAAYAGVPYLDGAFEELPGLTRTWTGEYSDYRKLWTPEVDKVWREEGGQELAARWGY